jgi:hypothetical protein
MQRKFRAKRILLAGASMLALMAGATGASAEPFDFTGMDAIFTAPTTGLYDITVKGAQGGQATGLAVFTGGLGAVVGGEISLTAGEMLLVVVGGQGASGDFGVGYGGGGGGRSEVDGLGNVLAIAGGGGGASEAQNGGSGLTGPTGGAGTNSNGGAGGLVDLAAAVASAPVAVVAAAPAMAGPAQMASAPFTAAKAATAIRVDSTKR